MAKKQIPAGTIAAFRSSHDPAHIARTTIIEGLRNLGAAWEYEGDFVTRCKMSRVEFARARDEFIEAHSFVPPRLRNGQPKRVWCGTTAFRKKLEGSIS